MGPQRLARGIALALPVLILLSFEGVARWLDLGDASVEPFLRLGARLFQFDGETGQYVIERDRTRSFNAQRFQAEKREGVFRVFVLGGSAAFGYPFGDPVSFSRWLRKAAPRIWPRRSFEIVNASGMSYGSTRLLSVAEEILEYEPDLILVYSGHNEFVEKELLDRPAFRRLVGLRSVLSNFRSYQLARDGLLALTGQRNRDEEQRDTFGIHVDRRENALWSAAERARAVARYAENLAALGTRCESESVPLLLVSPAPNVADWRPEHSVLDPALSAERAAAWAQAYASGRSAEVVGDSEKARDCYGQAGAISTDHADLRYRLGKIAEADGEYASAVAHYRAALDADELPVRVNSTLRDAARRVARSHGWPYVDAWQLLESRSQNRLLGSEYFWDYCHPNVKAHQWIAAAVCSVLVTGDRVDTDPAWEPGSRLDSADLSALGLEEWVELETIPRSDIGLWWLGNCADRQGDAVSARDYFERAHEVNADHPGALLGLAIHESMAGEHASAIVRASRALEIYQRHRMPRLAIRTRFELGVIQARSGDFDSAAGNLREVVRIDPGYAGAYATLGQVLNDSGNFEEAEAVLRASLADTSPARGTYREIARSLIGRGEYDRALEALGRELRLSPEDARVHALIEQVQSLRDETP